MSVRRRKRERETARMRSRESEDFSAVRRREASWVWRSTWVVVELGG